MNRLLNHHIAAKIRLTPSPSSANELQYIYENFSRLGIVESFGVKTPKLSFSDEINLVLSVAKSSTIDPLQRYQEPENHREIDERKNLIIKYFSKIVALPRYQYIKDDVQYLEGLSSIDFKYKLVKDGLKYSNSFQISPSTIEHPFCLINSINQEDVGVIGEIKRNLRFNFESFLKVDVTLA